MFKIFVADAVTFSTKKEKVRRMNFIVAFGEKIKTPLHFMAHNNKFFPVVSNFS
ncbi:MAG TPA: hypothetical protein VK105_17310 [Virgibacillus sp.]|nr:hypothetical protein [Virgibacillus sp.]HLR68853.1 hypothetical protein [Virgibacillus sp.]